MTRIGICSILLGIVFVSTLSTWYAQAASFNIIDIYRKQVFDIAVLGNRKPVVVFYYSSSSCGACKWSILPMLEKMVKRKSEQIYLAKVDIDKMPDLMIEHGITTIPTTMTYFEGLPMDYAEGTFWNPIVALVNKAATMKK